MAPSLKELRERLKLQQAINRELEKTAKLEERIARARSSVPKPVSRPSRPKGKAPPASSRARPVSHRGKKTLPRPKKARRPPRGKAFEALHPRGPGGRFLSKKTAQKLTPEPLRRWALFLRPAYGKKAYPNEVLVLILDEDPSKMSSEDRGAWVKAVRQARHAEDPKVRWVQEQGSGIWSDPTVEPGTWWVERREHLND